MKRLALVLLLVAAPAGAVSDKEDYAGGTVVFAKGTSLWKTDPKGKDAPTELVALPGKAEDVRMIRSDPSGAVLLFDLGGTWYWAKSTAGATAQKLDCADAPARLTADGACVLCADADGHAHLIPLDGGKSVSTQVPAEGARVVVGDGTRALVWADDKGLWRAPVKDLTQKTQLGPDKPVRGFVASPDGKRGVAIYAGHVYDHKQKVDADVLSGFALDGTAARRLLLRDGVVIDWSWDSQWLLLQHGDYACIARAVGGEYKCWKGYRAISIAPDGKWGLLLGPRSLAKVKDKGDDHHHGDAGEDKGGDSASSDDSTDTATTVGLPAQPFSLFRGRLEGAYTERPSLVETELDGAALWLPAPAP